MSIIRILKKQICISVVILLLAAPALAVVPARDAAAEGRELAWYLAEGSTAWGFSTYITIANPNPETVTASVTYMDPDGQSGKGDLAGRYITLPPLSQTTVDPRWDLGDTDFSTMVTCTDTPIAVDRTMMWNAGGAATGQGHNSIAVTAPSNDWYLPEGSSTWGFETWTLVQNPNATEANVELTYMTEGAWKKARKTIPAYSRASYSMQDDIGECDASIEVTSDVAVIAERSMYRHQRREGSCSIGATTPAADYFLAEGTTAWGFDTYVLVQNPNGTEASVSITYMTPDGPVAQPAFVMPPSTRRTIRVNDVPGVSNTDLSTQVHADMPIVAERAMYWNGGSDQGEACHDSIGVPEASKSFLLPDGQTSNGYETYTLVQNPGKEDVSIEVTYLPENGSTPLSFTDTVPPNSRRTYDMADKVISGRASIQVSVNGGVGDIIAERSIYWNNRGAGDGTIGIGGVGTRAWPKPAAGCPYFTQDYTLPQTQSAPRLAEWMASEHLEYDLDGWFFFGSLVDDSAPGDPGGFFISMQRIRTPVGGVDLQLVPAIVGFNSPTVGGKYVYGGAYTLDMAPFVIVESDPWRVEVHSLDQTGPLMTMSLASGTMGAAGAVYRLTADTPDNLGGRLEADVLVRDRLGAVNQGYGTSSFFPQFLTNPQRSEISGLFGNSVGDYLEKTGDPMTCQGSYYYSTPLMDVQSFSITRDGVPLSSGTRGTMWMDDIVQTYDEQASEALIGNASWKFFSIMLPEENASIMVIQIKSATGTLPAATLFRDDSGRTRNSARGAVHSWEIDKIDVEAVPGTKWRSPLTKQEYFQEHRVRLGSTSCPADLTIKMVRKNQEIVYKDMIKYEGLASVEGTLGGKPVKGTAFVELQPVGHQ